MWSHSPRELLRVHWAMRHARLVLVASATLSGIFIGSLLAFAGVPWSQTVRAGALFIAWAPGEILDAMENADLAVVLGIVVGWIGAYFALRYALKLLLRRLEAMPEEEAR